MSGYLSHLRVLDLTDERGLLAGHMLAQLGAEVVQVEPPGGSTARCVPPLSSQGDSLFWAAFAAGKRGVECDLATADGRAHFLSLLNGADILLESAEPGAMEALGLGYEQLRKINPGLVHVSVTAFGSNGPKSGYAASDLVVWAAGGYLLLSRDGEGRPVRFSVPQAFLHAAADAAAGALIACFARLRTGRGQHVDVSAQQSTALTTLGTSLAAQVGHPGFGMDGIAAKAAPGGKRQLDLSGSGSRTRKSKWQLRDGLAEMHLGIGPAAGRFANNMIAWLAEKGAVDEDIASWDWVTLPERLKREEVTEADLERARVQVAAFLGDYSKDDLIEIAIEKKLLLAPVMTTGDLACSPHHAARGFYQALVGASGKPVTLPGDFAMTGGSGFVPLRSAPGLGADNGSFGEGWERSVDHAALPAADQEAPLAGIKVLDLAWVVAGPLIGRALADFGADVIRVESSKRVETARVMGPFPGGKMDPEQSALYETCNAGKRGLTLNLASEEGREVIRDLVQWADVVVESFSPGQMANWGLGYDSLKAIKPSIIMLSTSLMGQSGPYTRYAGFGNVGAAVSGYQAIVGSPDSLPVGPFGPYTDFIGPRFGLVALLGALEHRRRTGEGGWLDVSQAEAGVQFLAPWIAHYSDSGETIALAGNRDAVIAPNGVFRCRPPEGAAESWLAISVRNDAEWRALALYIGGEGLAGDARFATLEARKENEGELERLLTERLAERDGSEVEAGLQAQGVPAHRVVSSEDMASDPQLAARGYFVRLPHPKMGETVVENARYQLSATPASVARAAPHFGRDNHEILTGILGYSEARFRALEAAGVLV